MIFFIAGDRLKTSPEPAGVAQLPAPRRPGRSANPGRACAMNPHWPAPRRVRAALPTPMSRINSVWQLLRGAPIAEYEQLASERISQRG
jgi:hypothetical protein